MTSAPPPRARGAGRAFLAYNALRFLLLAACLGVGWLVGLRGLALIVGALLVSGAISFLALRNQRIAMGMALEDQVGRARSKLAERTEAEDAYVDALAERQDPDRTQKDQPPGRGE
jgi:hypothetical protein